MKTRGFLVIIILVMVLVYFLWIMKTGEKANISVQVEAFSRVKLTLTKTNMTTLKRAITAFIAIKGRTPKTLKEIQTFHHIPLEDIDAWGKAIKYEKLSGDNFRLVSAGPDRAFNTQDDIVLEN